MKYLDDPTFSQWLHFRRGYAPIKAHVSANASHWPHRARSLNALLRYGRTVGMDVDVERSMRLAYAAYERDMEKGVEVPRRPGPQPLPEGKRRRGQTYSVAPTTDGKLADLQRVLDLDGKGAVIDVLVDKAHARRFKR